ncbi:MAG: phosphate ABC transporter substrate-binding protein [Candidatus Methanoplasma sp.]|jgi:phosphate transport system substrate-binding protein|nr:phosphate ABC transporter substrate-binding protein [Candidatus Methanoplasma sp.]
MIVAVLLVAVVCIAGAYLVVGNDKKENVTINAWGSTTVSPLMMELYTNYHKEHGNVTINIGGNGSGEAYNALINGTADIGMLSRALNASEPATPLKIASDAVVMIIDKNAGVTDLTLEQLAKIYAGEYTNWNEVGGNTLKIEPLVRESTSGTRACVNAILGPKVGMTERQFDELKVDKRYSVKGTEGHMLTDAQNTTGAIGYVGLGASTNIGSSMTALSVGGVTPSKDTILNGTYSISRPLFLATLGEPNEEVKAFLDWIISPAGQKIVDDMGFVPI